jgi:uncharacterized membrane protein YfcA
MPAWAIFLIIGVLAGITSGMFGVGGGIIIVPALVYFAAFSQHKATGTSLAVLLPPIGLLATLEYYRHGNVDLRAAAIIAITMIAGGWIGAHFANKVSGPHLRLFFGVFLFGASIYLIQGACKRLGWI